jgi:hypothetical protein
MDLRNSSFVLFVMRYGMVLEKFSGKKKSAQLEKTVGKLGQTAKIIHSRS